MHLCTKKSQNCVLLNEAVTEECRNVRLQKEKQSAKCPDQETKQLEEFRLHPAQRNYRNAILLLHQGKNYFKKLEFFFEG
jgi:hypothetical protein